MPLKNNVIYRTDTIDWQKEAGSDRKFMPDQERAVKNLPVLILAAGRMFMARLMPLLQPVSQKLGKFF